MSTEAQNIPVSLYTEMTPNPESLKFVVNKMLYPNQVAEFRNEEEANASPLAKELFGFPFVRAVFISQNFITITKAADAQWEEIMQSLKDFIKAYVASDKEIVSLEMMQAAETANENEAEHPEIIKKIKDLLDTYVKPAVEMDGGHISFKSYDEGVVTVVLQGACSGCPSSTLTLKAGIEGMMQRMIPEVKEVVAEEG